MATAQAIAAERSAVTRWQWIISAPDDLVWFIHYYLDSKIWRVRRDARLGESLRLAQS